MSANSQQGASEPRGLLKENIDGEALTWAHNRLIARPEQRKILMVISDGAPVDDTTLSANGGSYLDAHLREVIARVENQIDAYRRVAEFLKAKVPPQDCSCAVEP